MTKAMRIVFLFVTFETYSVFVGCACNDPVFQRLAYGTTKVSGEFNTTCEPEYKFEISKDFLENLENTIRINMETDTPLMNCTLLFTVFQKEDVFNVEIPFKSNKKEKFENQSQVIIYYKAGRTLCTPMALRDNPEARNISIHINTCSLSNVTFKMEINLRNKSVLVVGENRPVAVGPSTPQYFPFVFTKREKERNSYLKIITSSSTTLDDDICMTVSIQTLFCPVYDEEETVEYPQGIYVTMMKSSVVFISPSNKLFEEGFMLVYVVHENISKCLDGQQTKLRRITQDKSFLVLLEFEEDFSNWKFVLTLFFPLVCVVYGLLMCLGYSIHVRLMQGHLFPEIHEAPEDAEVRANDETPEDAEVRANDEPHEDAVLVVNNDSKTLKLNRFITLTEGTDTNLTTKVWFMILTVAFFYGLPSVEVVGIYLNSLDEYRNYDTCYYNERCALHVWFFKDFHHFWSNTSYVIFALIFWGILNFMVERRVIDMNDHPGFGVPYQIEILKALNLALCMEGFLSGTYHICPSEFTFQYDVFFIFLISIFITSYLLVARHPISFNPAVIYFSLALFVAVTLASYFADKCKCLVWDIIIYTIYACVYTPFYIVEFIYYHDIGIVLIPDDNNQPKPVTSASKVIRHRRRYLMSWAFPNHHHRDALQILVINKLFLVPLFALGTVVIYIFFREQDYTAQFLNVVIAISGLTCIHYCIQKIIYDRQHIQDKRLLIFPFISLCMTLVSGGFAVYFFINKSYNSNESAAKSRARNTECEFLFYDNHDFWHFLSSASLFSMFMTLLTMDDGLHNTPQTEIVVF